VISNEPVKNGCEVIYEMFHILNCRFEALEKIGCPVKMINVIKALYSSVKGKGIVDGSIRSF